MKNIFLYFISLIVLSSFFSKIYASTLSIHQQYSESEGSVKFSVSISNAQNDVRTFGFDIRYDLNVLNYSHYERGELALKGFQFLNTNNVSPGLIRIGGLETGDDIIPKGTSGILTELYFRIVSPKNSKLFIEQLKDDFLNWRVQNTSFHCEDDPIPLTEQEVKNEDFENNENINNIEQVESEQNNQFGGKKHSNDFENKNQKTNVVNLPLQSDISFVEALNKRKADNNEFNHLYSGFIDQNDHLEIPFQSQHIDNEKTKVKEKIPDIIHVPDKQVQLTAKETILAMRTSVKYIPVNNVIMFLGYGCLILLILIQAAIFKTLYQIKLYLKEVIKQ